MKFASPKKQFKKTFQICTFRVQFFYMCDERRESPNPSHLQSLAKEDSRRRPGKNIKYQRNYHIIRKTIFKIGIHIQRFFFSAVKCIFSFNCFLSIIILLILISRHWYPPPRNKEQEKNKQAEDDKAFEEKQKNERIFIND